MVKQRANPDEDPVDAASRSAPVAKAREHGSVEFQGEMSRAEKEDFAKKSLAEINVSVRQNVRTDADAAAKP